MDRKGGEPGSPREGEDISVLHVDDEPQLLELVGPFVERFDRRLSVATENDPDAAVERVRQEGFDAVVSDYDMPERDGLALLDAVRETDPDLPFVLFTGKGSEDIASDAISRGVTDYLQKGTGTDQYEVLANRVVNAVERHRARTRTEHAQAAMNAAWDGIAILDGDGRFTFVNEAYAAVFGYDREEMVGERWPLCYPEGGETVVYEEILPTARDAGTWTGETTLARADGSEFVGAHAVAALDDGGMVCVVRDLTERRDLDRKLQHERERFRLLVDEIEDYAIFMLDPEGRVRSWNDGAERIKGYETDEIVGEHISVFYPDTERAEGLPEHLLETAAEEGVATDRGKRVRADGSTFWADVTITALYDNGDLRGFGKVTEDVTAERERERRRERNEAYRKRLYELTSDPERDVEEKVPELLGLGVDRLGVENGHLVRVDREADRHEVVATSGDHPAIEPGEVTALSSTYCRKTVSADAFLSLHDAPEQGWEDDPAYESYGFSCYLGAKVETDDDLFGTVCFVDRDARDVFRHDEKAFVHLVSQWLGYELSFETQREVLTADD